MKRLLSIATLYPNADNPRFGIFVEKQMEALAARGDWDVTVLNPLGIPPLAWGRYAGVKALCGREERQPHLTVYRFPFTLIPRLGAPFNPAFIIRAALPLAKRLHAEKPFDAVDAQFLYPDAPAAAAIASALNLPLSVKARGADVHFWGRKPYAKKAILRAAKQAQTRLAVCDALADDFANLGIERTRIFTHYTGLDHSVFHPIARQEARDRLNIRFGIRLPPTYTPTAVLATTGALIPRKGQGYAIKALALLPGAKLLLAGKGEDENRLKRLAFEHGLADRVHFLGSLAPDALAEVLSAANVMVLPSSSEGLANAWVEALACGTPLVITDAGGAREIVTSPEAGRIVERCPKAIARAVQDIVSNQPAQSKVAACAARFSWEENASQLAAYYERLTQPMERRLTGEP